MFLCAALADHLRQRRRTPGLEATADLPPTTALVPAWNEARVIEATVRALAASDHPDLEILVVDDGSTDDTAAIVEGLGLPRVRVVRQPANAGKPAALDAGLQAAGGDWIVTVDADTVVEPDCARLLVATAVARDADAVAGNIKVGNRRGLIGHAQSVEYITGLNVDRRAQTLLGFVTTVPGAASAWRRQALLDLGGFSADTFAEDTDLSLALLRAGARVEFCDRAIAWTEAPDTWPGLFRQRLRWLHGNLQCALKHTFRRGGGPRLWLLGLPNLWLAHLGMYLLYPLFVAWAVGFRVTVGLDLLLALLGGVVSIDLLAMLAAYLMDRDDPREVVWAPLMRLCWPLLLEAVFVTVILRWLARVPMRWYQPERRGVLEPPVGEGTAAPAKERVEAP